jgi:PAS domain S-box-containing protein
VYRGETNCVFSNLSKPMQLQDNEQLKTIVESAPIGICILDATTFVAELVNDKFLEIAGKPREAILGKWYWEPFAEAREYYEGPLKSVPETGKAFYADQVELMLIRHGKEEIIFVTFVYSPVADKNGTIRKVAVWVLENTKQVTERQKTEAARAAIQQERDRLKDFFMQAPAGICILDGPNLVFELVNPLYQELLPGRNLLHRPLFEALPELLGTPLEQILLRVYHAGESYKIDESLIPIAEYEGGVTRDRYFTFNYQPRRNEENKVDGIMVFVFEVTGIIRVQQQLREARERAEQQKRIYETVTSSTPDLMYVFGLDYRFTYANTALLSMWGKSYEDSVGKSLLENGYEPWHAAMHEREIDQVVATKLPVRGEVEFPHAILGKRVYDYIFTPVINEQGEVEAVAGTTRDVTERKLDETRKGDFIAMVSHELKTPLTSLTAIIQIAESKLKTSQDIFLVSAMERANRQVRRMTDMINGFLNISRLESGKIHIDKQEFDIVGLISDVIAETRLTTSDQVISFEGPEPIGVNADRDKITSVISNYISNAIKYSLKEQPVIVKCITDSGQVIVSVTDKGMGVNPGDLAKIFERYYRVETEGTRRIPGFGIGLYLSSEIIERHGGKVWAESQPGAGSTFYFSLPLEVS